MTNDLKQKSLRNLTVAYLTNQGLLLDKKQTASELITLQASQLNIMQETLARIAMHKNNQMAEVKITKTSKQKWIDKIKLSLFIFAGTIGLIEAAFWTFFGTKEAISIILPMTFAVAIIPVCVALTAICAAQFIGFELNQVKDMLGIELTSDARKSLDIIQNKVECVEKINVALCNIDVINRLSTEDYQSYMQLASLFNEDIKSFKKTFKEEKEGDFKKFIRYSTSMMGLVIGLLEAYLGTKLIISSFIPLLIGTPYAIAAIIAVMVATTILYFSMRGSGIEDLLNPTLQKSKEVREALNKYEPKEKHDFSKIMKVKTAIKTEYKTDQRVRLKRSYSMSDLSLFSSKPKSDYDAQEISSMKALKRC